MKFFFHELISSDFYNLDMPSFCKTKCHESLSHWKQIIMNSTNFVNLSHNTCAVVGSSSNIMNTKHGKKIDSLLVIRINDAVPNKKHEAFIGSKTHVRIWGSKPPPNFPYQNEFWIQRCPRVPWIGWCWNDISKDKRPRFHSLVSQYVSKLIRNVTKKYSLHPQKKFRQDPSTGSIALSFAMNYCKKVEAFGFGPSNNSKCQKYTKHNRACNYDLNDYHDFEAEWKWMCNLHTLKKINLVNYNTMCS